MVQIISMLDMIVGNKLKIVNFILDSIHFRTNTMIATTRDIAKPTTTNLQSKLSPLKILTEGKF
ncbi:replication/maintenance protein RepL, partial [Staphylococcus aureus]|uniref:replication/maintenance protein RepL n=1 Tax=Staphylococcus aureus TaxID=1280 RepID=UPI004059B97E